MFMSMLLIPILNRKYEKKQKIKNEENRQKRYKKYINSKIKYIDNIMKKQKEILFENYISEEECAKIILNREPRLWERKIDDNDFLTIRVGTGDKPLDAEIEYPKKEFTMEDDNLVEILNTIVNKSKILKDVPITFSLADKNISALIVQDNERIVEKFMQNMIIQLISLHSYEDLKLVFLTKNSNGTKWEHYKNLPHVWDNSKKIRFFADNYNDLKEISRVLEAEFASRITKERATYKQFSPYYLIITDDYKNVKNLKIITDILKYNTNIGFGIFCITDNLVELPNECQMFIELKNNNGTMFESEISSTSQKNFKFDSSYTIFFERISKLISDIPIKYSANEQNSLPNSYSFLEMYDSGRIEQLNIYDRWKTNDTTLSLQAPIGIDTAGMPIMLDIHEKYHGPHGLIAGSTGSGKSEFIITYVLSLAVNYHPYDVSMLLIDYKGGGLAGAFKKQDIQLPHLVGTITNIDTAELQRSLVSIQSELRRRQILFNEARNKTDEGTIDIYKYQKLYHNGIVDVPIAHLLIICDEFAELKQQQPEFMDELISVARIGRSLGVHLILATQKPAGVVNEQIKSNSKFGIALKVQDRQDSMDVIKRPDAASLKKVGQFYLQVGNNEYFTLGLAAYAGAPYIPSDRIKKSVDNSIKIISNTGSVIKEIDDAKKEKSERQGEQLTCIVKYMSNLANQENIKVMPLWLDKIPEKIFIQDIREKYNIVKEKNNIQPLIGEYDDPFNQRQGPVLLNLSEQGNTIIFGNAESGKETLLSTIVYSIMNSYTIEEIQMYIMDFGSEALKIFKDSPFVGDVVLSSDTEKVDRLFEMIQKEIKDRTEILSEYGGDYKLYINTSGKVMPMKLIILNNYVAFSENYSDKYDDILSIVSREGTKCGIVFIVTATTYNEIRYRLQQNFKQKIALQLNNEDDFANIFEGIRKKRPSHIFGRGLVKLDDVYEFQTAIICEPEQWNVKLKENIQQLNNRNKERAKKIPVLPEVVTFEDVKDKLLDIKSVPIGINNKNLNVVNYDFKKNLVTIITSKSIDISVEFAIHLIDEMKRIENVNIVILDAEGIFQSINNSVELNYRNLVLEIENNLKKSKQVVCFIIGLDKFINDSSVGESNFYELLKKAEQLKNYSFIVVDNFNKIKGHEYNDWYKNYVPGDCGIWIGNGIGNQYLIKVNTGYNSTINNCGNSFGYVIKQEDATMVKLLGMKDKGEDDE